MREGKVKRLWFQKATESSISVPTNEQNLSGKTLQEALAASMNYKDELCSHMSVQKYGVNMSPLLCIEKQQHFFHQLNFIVFILVPNTEAMRIFLCTQVLMLNFRPQREGICLQIWFAHHRAYIKMCRLSKSGSRCLVCKKIDFYL